MKTPAAYILICLTLLSCLGAKAAAAEDPVKDIEITEATIKFSRSEFPRTAYLYTELKNNGGKDIANLDFEISYYDKESYLIKKVVLKNKLTEAIPSGEARKYRIRLTGDVFNERHEKYPYSRSSEVDDFDMKILNVKFTRK